MTAETAEIAQAGERSPLWRSVRRAHLLREPVCQWCGSRTDLQAHHIFPFHLFPVLELVASNIITLCEPPGPAGCHLKHGHLGNWGWYNPNIRAECAKRKIAMRPQFIQKIQETVKPLLPVGGLLSQMTATKADDIGVCVIETLVDDEFLDTFRRILTAKLAARGISLDALLAIPKETAR